MGAGSGGLSQHTSHSGQGSQPRSLFLWPAQPWLKTSRARHMLFPCETPSVSRCSSGLEPSCHSCHCSPPASASHGFTECAPSPGTAASGSFWTPVSAVPAAVALSSTARSIYYTLSMKTRIFVRFHCYVPRFGKLSCMQQVLNKCFWSEWMNEQVQYGNESKSTIQR